MPAFRFRQSPRRQPLSTSLSCARCARSSLLLRFDSAIFFLFSRAGVRTCWILAQIAAFAEPILLELALLIDRVSVRQVVDSLSCPLVKPENKPRARASPIRQAERRQRAADLMRIQPGTLRWSGGFGMARILGSFLRTKRVQSCVSYPSRMVLRLFGFVVSAGADIDCFIQFLPRSVDGLLCLAP